MSRGDEQHRNGQVRVCQHQVVGKADTGHTSQCEEVGQPSGSRHNVGGPHLFRVVCSSEKRMAVRTSVSQPQQGQAVGREECGGVGDGMTCRAGASTQKGEKRYSPIRPTTSHVLPTFPSTGVKKVGVQAVVFIKTLQRHGCFSFWQAWLGCGGGIREGWGNTELGKTKKVSHILNPTTVRPPNCAVCALLTHVQVAGQTPAEL